MRIEGFSPSFYINPPQPAAQGSSPVEPQKTGYGPGVIVDISPQAWAAYNSAKADGVRGIAAAEETQGCETCKNRKYVDSSDDPSVSFQTPTRISPGQAAGRVMAHEREHVTNEQARAQREDRRVISQSVSLTTSMCPECGKMYVSGGVTRTVTAGKKSIEPAEQQTNEISV
ncbi:MAG: hypothetical protein LBH44_04580 [Treponema sp.]|jgi:ribosomal protein L32|nr:hypothetical protein [Treponema sp.]